MSFNFMAAVTISSDFGAPQSFKNLSHSEKHKQIKSNRSIIDMWNKGGNESSQVTQHSYVSPAQTYFSTSTILSS